jgi:hypothetical protein
MSRVRIPLPAPFLTFGSYDEIFVIFVRVAGLLERKWALAPAFFLAFDIYRLF